MKKRSNKKTEEPKKKFVPGKVTFSYASESLDRQRNYVKPPSKFETALKALKKFWKRVKNIRVPKYVVTNLKDLRKIRAPKFRPVKIYMTKRDIFIVIAIGLLIFLFLAIMVYQYYRIEYKPYWM